ncbi:MAG TPA: TRAP transporter substrate-binding protein DctP [Bryobacteraceae bacterium]|jgi:TRAP-type C4-dicarboxylate transport system substrate-binding protein|nr:TRAP transporter substrate-binding protein DctP [Bryobacteraceae bacterium]
MKSLTITLAALLCGLAGAASAQPINIKMATLAPKDSPWCDVLVRMGERWKAITNGNVKLTLYAGGVMGDEPDTVNKLRVKLIQAVALTGAGMGEIEKGVAALQIPMMFDSYDELDYVRDRMAPTLEKRIEANGYVVLNWGDAGWVYFFADKPMPRIDDMRKLKMFSWAGSNDELEQWKANGFHPVALAATDIQMGLKTGLIDVIPTTPLYALWNQCFTLAKYMTDIKWAPLVGATVVSKAVWDKIPEAQRGPMLQAARDSGQQLRSGIRDMGDKAISVMTNGLPGKKMDKLTIIHADEATVAEWRRQTEAAYPAMRGKIIPADLFDEARRLHEEYRAKKGGRK